MGEKTQRKQADRTEKVGGNLLSVSELRLFDNKGKEMRSYQILHKTSEGNQSIMKTSTEPKASPAYPDNCMALNCLSIKSLYILDTKSLDDYLPRVKETLSQQSTWCFTSQFSHKVQMKL